MLSNDLSSWSSGKVGKRTTSPIWTLLSSSPSSSVLPSWRCWAIPSRRCHHCLPPSSCCSLAYFATAPAGEIIHILQIVFFSFCKFCNLLIIQFSVRERKHIGLFFFFFISRLSVLISGWTYHVLCFRLTKQTFACFCANCKPILSNEQKSLGLKGVALTLMPIPVC